MMMSHEEKGDLRKRCHYLCGLFDFQFCLFLLLFLYHKWWIKLYTARVSENGLKARVDYATFMGYRTMTMWVVDVCS